MASSPTQLLLDYIQTCVFVYLHNRKIYSENTFDRRRAFDVIVQTTRQPELLAYVSESLSSVKPWIERGELKQICAVLMDQKGNVAERLDFEFLRFEDVVHHTPGVLSKLLNKDLARAGLVRLSRLQLPEFTCVNFSLAFEIEEKTPSATSKASEMWIAKDAPSLPNIQEETRQSTLPVITLADANVDSRICIKVETTLLK